jgi:hypothetical protein
MYVRDLVISGAVIPEHVGKDLMTPDVLTKPLHGDTFKRHREKLMGLMWDKYV